MRSASTTVTVTPVTYVRFVPFAPSALPIANPSAPILVSLVAVAANDTANAGVDWSVCSDASTCGEFQVAPGIPATATSIAVPPVYSATLHAASGQAVSYLPPTQVPGSGNVTVTATSTADKVAHPANPADFAAVIAIVDDTQGVTGVADSCPHCATPCWQENPMVLYAPTLGLLLSSDPPEGLGNDCVSLRMSGAPPISEPVLASLLVPCSQNRP